MPWSFGSIDKPRTDAVEAVRATPVVDAINPNNEKAGDIGQVVLVCRS